MIERQISVKVPGRPAPAGSLKCVGRHAPGSHANLQQDKRPGQKEWRQLLVDVFARKVKQRADAGQPIGVDVTFVVERPKAHHVATDRSRPLRHNAPTYPTGHGTNDTDKMLRLLDDALQEAGVLPNDAQVVEVAARKRYPGPELPYTGAHIVVYPLEGRP